MCDTAIDKRKKKRVMRKSMSCCRHVKVNNAVTSFFLQ